MLWGPAGGGGGGAKLVGSLSPLLGVEERVDCSGFADASGVGLIQEGQAGGGSGAQLVGRISSFELRRGPGVRGAKACARLSFRGRRVNRSGLLVFPAAQLQGVRMDRKLGAQSVEGCNGDPGGCCSGQLFAVVVMGGATTPKGVFAALTTHAKSRSSGQ
eukprot:scaffold4550_cov128-Isochrysis_galbana.AAC.6